MKHRRRLIGKALQPQDAGQDRGGRDLRAELEIDVQRITGTPRDIQHVLGQSPGGLLVAENMVCQRQDSVAQQDGRVIARRPGERLIGSRDRQRLTIQPAGAAGGP